jgi:HAD superfamily hydrolase (TIGR01509 family)
MTSSPVRLVCFDLGGVLVRIVRTWTDACRRAGVTLAPDPAAWRRHEALLLRYETGEFDDAGYLRELPACLPGVSPEHIHSVFDAWLVGMYPDAAELLAELKQRGVKTGCLSNTNDRHWRTIMRADSEYAPLAELDYRFASHELGVMKPAERAYRLVEERTGLKGEQVLFFDDKPENVAAARAVGWRAEVIDRVDDAAAQLREYLHAHGVL